MNRNLQNWLKEHSKFTYETYSKPISINERIGVLTPIFVALGAGYFYLGSNAGAYNSNLYGGFFYAPIVSGGICLVVAIYLILWAMILRSDLKQMPNPQDVLAHVEGKDRSLKTTANETSTDMDSLSLETISQFELQYIKKSVAASQFNFDQLSLRSAHINKACRFGLISFSLLLISLTTNTIYRCIN